tara:strand:- start:511 stop:1440 length:930 start_codon:yes stop_codon:yes gene_type:complete
MVKVTHREKTEEEKKVIEEARKTTGKWMGEEKLEDIVKPEIEDGEKVTLKINQIPAITFLEGKLPRIMLDELNAHIDEHRENLENFSQNLVGQIKQTEKSQQLSLDRTNTTVQGLINLFGSAGRAFLKSYSGQIPMDGGADAFDEAPIDCFSMWTVHSYEGDYNPLHDHDVSYDQKCMAFSIILYCKVPPQISYEGRSNKVHSNGGATDGCTYFSWGSNTGADHLVLKPKTDRYVVPEEGKFLIFPSWLNHSVAPFYGNGERRTLSANFRVPFSSTAKDKSSGDLHFKNMFERDKEPEITADTPLSDIL